MNWRPSRLATAPVVPAPKKGSRITSPGLVEARITRCSSASGFWVEWAFGAGRVLHPLIAGADRQGPVRAHLQFVVGRLHRFIVEGVAARAALLGRPDQGLMRVGEARALEVRHGVGLAPDHVVQDPEAQVLQRRADAEDVVVAADHPEGARRPSAPAAPAVSQARVKPS